MNAIVRAYVPTISPGQGEHLSAMAAKLALADIDLVVIANSASAAQSCAQYAVPFVDFGANLGFGEALNAAIGADANPADWVFILNDDVELDPELLAPATLRLRGDDLPRVVFLDPEPWRRIPGVMQSLITLSLLSGIFRKVGSYAAESSGYKSFSAVVISQTAWSIIGGFDTNLKFNYEDADFVRRARGEGIAIEAIGNSGVHHQHSVTGRRYIDVVLPVSAWSTRGYLMTLGVHRSMASGLCVLALIVRVPLSLFVSGSRRRHLAGIGRAIGAILRGREPSLPEYQAL